MERNVLKELIKWKHKSNRKPLILNGARQVGKTYILREFGRLYYQNVAYINCDRNEQLALIFSVDYDTKRIIRSLSAILHMSIIPGDTLIIFDEIQESPIVLNALKYFYENTPEYHIAVAGSLLGISLHGNTSFPVGKVDMIKMYPMTFDEFLLAIGQESLAHLLQDRDYTIIDSVSISIVECLRQYYFVGGMPAAVLEYSSTENLQEVRALQRQILFDYRRDFSKHAPVAEVPRINMVWDSIPAQLAKENKKFIYSSMKKGARGSEFELAIQWLIDAGLVYRVHRATSPFLPLKFYEERSVFKLFSIDVGLMGAMTDTPAENIIIGDNIFREYKGAFTELFVYTQLIPQDKPIYYYSANDSRVEIDFLVQNGAKVIPVEVKAEENVKSKSLRTYLEKYPDLTGMRLSMLPYMQQERIVNVPLYCVNYCL